MMKIERPHAPDFLRRNYKKWGKRYKRKRDNPRQSNDFNWATFQSQKVNQLLLPTLQEMTNCHCSFCDGFPLDALGETIEHFRSKSRYPLLSYFWGNLFYCCHHCQKSKGENPERLLLKPDAADYSFEKYFLFDYITGNIEINPALSSETEKAKAKNIIKLYGLNEYNRPKRRKDCLQRFLKTSDADVEDFPYRFILI